MTHHWERTNRFVVRSHLKTSGGPVKLKALSQCGEFGDFILQKASYPWNSNCNHCNYICSKCSWFVIIFFDFLDGIQDVTVIISQEIDVILGAAFSTWNIIALRDTAAPRYMLCDDCSFRTKVHALVAKINDLHSWKKNIYLQRLNGITICGIVQNYVRVKSFGYKTVTANVFSHRVQNCNCLCPCAALSGDCVYKTWHWKFISRYPNVGASKEQICL